MEKRGDVKKYTEDEIFRASKIATTILLEKYETDADSQVGDASIKLAAEFYALLIEIMDDEEMMKLGELFDKAVEAMQ